MNELIREVFVEQPLASPGSANYLHSMSVMSVMSVITLFVKESAPWAQSFYKTKCPFVCLFTFEVPFKHLFAPLPKVGILGKK